MFDVLLTVNDVHFDAEPLVYVLGEVLCTVHTAVLAARTAEAEHQMGEPALYVSRHVLVGQGIYVFQKGDDFAVIFKKADDGFVQARKLFVWFLTPGVVRGTAVEHISSAVTRRVVRYAALVGKAVHGHHQRALAVIL